MTKTIYISADTDNLLQKKVFHYELFYSKKYNVPILLIQAIIKTESLNNIFAIRFEKHLKTKKWYNRSLLKTHKKDEFAYCSYGLMQILFGTARSHGYRGTPFMLYQPKYNIKYGTKYLSFLLKRYKGNIDDVISSYNQGTPRKKNGKYLNQPYVNKVKKAMKLVFNFKN